MRTSILALFASTLLIGCASSGANRRSAAAPEWPLGNDARQRAMHSLQFGPPGQVRFQSRAPVYVVFLELRPTLDSLDVRFPKGDETLEALTGPVDLVVPAETVDRLTMPTASAPATNCTIMRNAGDEVGGGHEFCPVSRSYGRSGGRPWAFRNKVFLLVSTMPFPTPLARTIPYAGQRTVPPVASGGGWTVITL